jgi:hypothetical protein
MRYVILEHDHPERHWDFMVEAGPVLRTWRLLAEPAPGRAVPAEPSFDHRLIYLDYEGPISGGRGIVARWDEGTLTWEAEEEGRLTMRLVGRRFNGRAVLERDDSGQWWFHGLG